MRNLQIYSLCDLFLYFGDIDIGHLVKVKGMVTRASDVKPQITVCTYLCEMCGSEIFQDILGPQYMPIQKCPSQRCTDNKTSGKITMQTRGSRFVKYQELRLQELPDQVPVGHIPRSLTIHCRYTDVPLLYHFLPFFTSNVFRVLTSSL